MACATTIRCIFILAACFLTAGGRNFRKRRPDFDASEPVLEFDLSEMTLALHSEGSFRIRSSHPLATAVNVTFRQSTGADDKVIVELHKSAVVLSAGKNGTEWTTVKLTAVVVGHDRFLRANCTNVNDSSGVCQLSYSRGLYFAGTAKYNTPRIIGRLHTEDSSLRIAVVHSIPLLTVIQIFGWVYFLAWSISFYPQIYMNFRRRSVLGLSFDFLGLNATGFLFYSLFNCAMYWIHVVQDEYEDKYPDGVNPVLLNDVIFSLHALFATLVTIAQCFVYEKAHQRVSRLCIGVLSVIWLTAILAVIVAATKTSTWLTFFNILSGLKLAITLIKYVPQAYYNYRRKSTAGWSIGNILLDFTGGSTSLLQMFLLAYNNDDWKEIFGDFTKFGLGAISLSFDVLFMFQHFGFYRNSIHYEPQDSVGDEDDDVPKEGQEESIHVPYVDVDERRTS